MHCLASNPLSIIDSCPTPSENTARLEAHVATLEAQLLALTTQKRSSHPLSLPALPPAVFRTRPSFDPGPTLPNSPSSASLSRAGDWTTGHTPPPAPPSHASASRCSGEETVVGESSCASGESYSRSELAETRAEVALLRAAFQARRDYRARLCHAQ